MSAAERTVAVVEFDVANRNPGEHPSGRALVAAATRQGFDRVVVHARATADGWAVVHPHASVRMKDNADRPLADLTLAEALRARCADGRLVSLEDTMLEARRRKIGLVIRIHDTLVTEALAGALGIMAGDGRKNDAHSELRSRFLVVVPDARIGKRLRTDSRPLPSGRSLPHIGGGWRGALVRRLPNFARAAADADDLVIHATLASPARVREKLVPHLAKRGAYVWIEGVTPETRADYEDVGAGGLLIETPYAD